MASIFKQQHEQAVMDAAQAGQDYLDKYFNGQDGGACGFAWVMVFPPNKGNTRAGRDERRMLESIGFRKDVYGKAWRLNNPGQIRAQNIDAKSASAQAYADTMNELAVFDFQVSERLD